MRIDYSQLPEHMQDGMRRYIENGILPGDFLTAVLCNDFVTAFMHADDVNIVAMREYAYFLHWQAPPGCWGSDEKVNHWSEMMRNFNAE
jgi:hypothetical protein